MTHLQTSAQPIVITGLGILSPVGIGAGPFWESLSAGRSGIGPVETMSHSAAPGNVGGEVRDFTEKDARKTYLKKLRKSIKIMCREIQMGVASAGLAVEHSGLNVDEIDRDRFGVDFGANLMFSPPEVLQDACRACIDGEGDDARFRFEKWGTDGLQHMEPLWLLRYLPNMPGCHIGILTDARGPNNSLTLEEASGNLAIGEALRVIHRGAADVILAGTTGTRLHPVKTLHAALWDDLAEFPDPPESWSRPFDKSRSGQVLAEGACCFLLEKESAATARGATVFGTVLGAGASCVIDGQGRADIRQALVSAMNSALRAAGLEPKDIGHINAHGLSDRRADAEEAAAIREVFGQQADDVPVTALKSYFGNAGAGCGPLELAGSLLALRHGVVPPTRNYTQPDPECPLNVVHGAPLPVDNKTLLKINVTRMGQASAVVVAGA